MGKCLFMRKGTIHTVPIALPSGYTKLAYIRSSGTQYIDTGFKANQNTRVVCDVDWVPTGTAWLFGGRTSYNNTAYGFLTSNGTFRSEYGNVSNADISIQQSGRFIVDKDKNITKFNGGIVDTRQYSSFRCLYNIVLFAINDKGAIHNYSNAKLYSCQIYDNDVLVRDFVPCINASGEVGLYDLVGKQFYGNAGTGVFTGSEVV